MAIVLVSASAAQAQDGAAVDVQVDWFAELTKGGLTMVALGALSVVLLVCLVERIVHLRRKRVAPPALLEAALKTDQPDADRFRRLCQEHDSSLARVVRYIVDHRHNRMETITQGGGDVGAREHRAQMQRIYPLAAIAGMAPLLGLLGTMIGMIEAFTLVAFYGDEGGAAMLAGSIAKALITTAVGLVLALPAVAAYQFFKLRLGRLFNDMEADVERIMDHWFHRPEAEARLAARGQSGPTSGARPAARPSADGRPRKAPEAPRQTTVASQPSEA